MPRSARPPDLSARLKGRLRVLRARLESREALIEVVREANAAIEPRKVAGWLLRQAQGWIPAPIWAVVVYDGHGHPAIVAQEGLTVELEPSLWSAAEWISRYGGEFFAADLAKDGRARPGAFGTAVGFPLACRARTLGALVGLDSTPSKTAPSLGPSLILAIRELLEPAALALDTAMTIEKLEALSVTDDLTRLYNSRFLRLVLRRESKRATRSGNALSLLFLDIDSFKLVNDTHGHLAGSQALAEVAAVIRACARETDVVARFGGDEFSVVLPDTGRDGAVAVAERIRDRLRATLFLATEGLSLHLTASIGVATLPDVAASAEELLRAADKAMYTVKAIGKDGIHIAEEETPPPPSPDGE